MSHSGSGLGALSMQRLGCRTGSIWRCSTLTEPGMRLQILANWRWSVIFLAFEIVLDGGFIFVSAQLCDRGHPPELLVTSPDTPTGWQDTCRLIAACVRNQIKSLSPRPLEIGESGPNGFVIE
jgi:hypothetical protein